jgi:hypothetical protein
MRLEKLNTAASLLAKFIMTFIFAAMAFRFIDANNWGWIFSISLAATVINYLVGDLMVLPALGNVIASIGNGLMGAGLAFVFGVFAERFAVSFAGLGGFALLVAIGEYFFHRYLRSSDKVAP